MNDFTTTAPAPLTRREAREIERRTGRRPVVGAVAPTELSLTVATDLRANALDDTSRIERNDVAALVSVVPTEIIDRIAAPSPLAESSASPDDVPDAFRGRGVSVRAARPGAIVARDRRRRAAGFAIAASAAALATAGAIVPGQLSDAAAQNNQASLLSAAAQAEAQQAAAAAAQPVEAPAAVTDLVAAPEQAASEASFTVETFSADEVSAAVAPPEPVETEETAPSEDTSSDSDTGSGGGGGEFVPGNGYGQGIIATAESMLGGGNGWLCTDFVSAVLSANGVPHAQGTVSTMAASGTQVSNPEPGDLVVFNSGHIGIYAGGGMMYDNPGEYSQYVGWQNVHRSIDVIGSSYYFVRMG